MVAYLVCADEYEDKIRRMLNSQCLDFLIVQSQCRLPHDGSLASTGERLLGIREEDHFLEDPAERRRDSVGLIDDRPTIYC